MNHYQNQASPEAAKLLLGVEITFSVLMRIVQGECRDIITDHENILICYSTAPFPVWVWCRDVSREEDVRTIARCLREHFPVERGFAYNISYELLDALKREDAYFLNTRRKMGLRSHRLDEIQEIHHPCDGCVSRLLEEEIPGLIPIWHDMHYEMEGHDLPAERCEATIRRMREERALHVWRNSVGEIVALTGRTDAFTYSKITSVYTLPQHRRKGYAINLVHHVTQTILDDGLTPILYTNADYVASNDCYRKIGYREVGNLCCVSK